MTKEVLLQKLAEKIQIQIKPEEVKTCLQIFDHLEELLTVFKKTEIKPETTRMERIDVGKLTLQQLEDLSKNFPEPTRIEKKEFN